MSIWNPGPRQDDGPRFQAQLSPVLKPSLKIGMPPAAAGGASANSTISATMGSHRKVRVLIGSTSAAT